MSPGGLISENLYDAKHLIDTRYRPTTFVCDLTGDPQQQARLLKDFLSDVRPWFVNIVGPRESLFYNCNYSIQERVSNIFRATLATGVL